MPDGTFLNQLDEASSLMALALSRLEPGPVLTEMRDSLEQLIQRAESYAAEPATA